MVNKMLTGQPYRPEWPKARDARLKKVGASARANPGPATVTREHVVRAAIRMKAQQLAAQRAGTVEGWPSVYVNRESGKAYQAHNDEEVECLVDDQPPRLLVKGGEGSGKSVFGVIKSLERLRRGCNGVMGSPDLPHFKRSLWPEFRRWCPWEMVVPRQRRLSSVDWEPSEAFTLTFINGAQLICGGFENPGSWEGPNLNFAHYDEARKDKTPAMLKVLDGRVRIMGPGGIPPQLWFTTTPKKHWLYTYFGPLDPQGDELEAFKSMSRTITLRTIENIANLEPGYVERRSQSLTAAEVRVLMDADWEDLADAEAFLASMVLWDALSTTLPPLGSREPLVFAADAGVSNDSFALVGVGFHPGMIDRVVVPRVVLEWVPERGVPLNFNAIEKQIVAILRSCNAVHFCYDPYQLHQMASSIDALGVVGTVKPFGQQGERLAADKALLDLIMTRGLLHDGDPRLRAHIANADKLYDDNRTRMRLVKRNEKDKIDLAVALAMASARLLDPKVLDLSKNLTLPVGLPVGLVSRP